MAAIQNRSRIVVTVRARADLTHSFPFDALDAVQSYVDELRSKGFKPTAKQSSDTWEVRIRQKGFPSQNLTFKSYAHAQTFIKKVESERSTGLFRDYTKAHLTTFAELLVRYLREFKRKSFRVIAYKIEAWLEDSGPNGQRLLEEHRKAQEEAGLPVRKAGFQMRKPIKNVEWLHKPLSLVTADDINGYIKARLEQVSPATVDREVDTFSAVFRKASAACWAAREPRICPRA